MIGYTDPSSLPSRSRGVRAHDDASFESIFFDDCVTEVPGGYSPCEIEFIEYVQLLIDLHTEYRREGVNVEVYADEQSRIRYIAYLLNVLIGEIDRHES